MRGKNSRWVRIIIIGSLIFLAALLVWQRNFFFSFEGLLSLVLIVVLIAGLFRILNNVLGFFANTKDSIELFQLVRPRKRPLTPEEIRQNRKNMLKQLELRIVQTLKSKLLTDEWLKLGFKFDPEQIPALEAPQEWRSDGEVKTIRRGTKPVNIFDNRAASALLILGEPGSGKTITLFRLAQELVERAMKEDTETIPIVFNLASWAEKQPTLDEWLMEQLERVYRVPERVAHYWIEHGALTLLLDGLDEIRDKIKREACVQAINAYRLKQNNLTKIAVCSRIDEYEELATQLELNGAIIIRALKPNEAKQFLKSVATNENNLLPIFETNEVVQQLAKRPLTLNILAVTVRGLSKKELDKLVDEPEQILPRLYDVYIKQMLQHRGEDANYPPKQTIRGLAWLAYQLKQHGQKDFLADTIQFNWLPKTFFLRLNFVLISGLIVWLILGPVLGLFLGLLFGLKVEMINALIILLIIAPFASLKELQIKFNRISDNLLMIFWKIARPIRGTLGVGLIVGLFFGPIAGLFLGLFFGLTVGVFSGLDDLKADVISEGSTHPTEPIRATIRAAMFLCAFFSINGSLIFGVLYGLFGLEGLDWEGLEAGRQLLLAWNNIDALIGGVAGISLGLAVMLHTMNGVIYHWVLKRLLARQGFIPVDLFPFLDFATERQLLVRPGGHYEFFHQTLQDHFVTMWLDRYAKGDE